MQAYNPWLKSPSFSLEPSYKVLVPMPASSPSQDVRITPARGGGLLFETLTEGQIHIVQTGETLFGLSRRYGLSVETLRQLNGLSPTAPILVGQKLLISQETDQISTPAPNNDTSEFIYHTVERVNHFTEFHAFTRWP
ncbi:MAG: LysM peptidoglycan-binding domain-containing protein [Microscillaceae bacterium]|nr:LysM peptidoglycan-binding domain-containing protein [Microscillaceae bacterium]